MRTCLALLLAGAFLPNLATADEMPETARFSEAESAALLAHARSRWGEAAVEATGWSNGEIPARGREFHGNAYLKPHASRAGVCRSRIKRFETRADAKPEVRWSGDGVDEGYMAWRAHDGRCESLPSEGTRLYTPIDDATLRELFDRQDEFAKATRELVRRHEQGEHFAGLRGGRLEALDINSLVGGDGDWRVGGVFEFEDGRRVLFAVERRATRLVVVAAEPAPI